ncbi:hypothetical protein apy_06100 [Aeropyrum pernix]|uniref:DUF2192 domain-containing protein n=1 Tax=Aeropyrum pernix TaxID=56636 RepID=A0A401H8V8_AERPX|nr:DUF2192 domain-containing protein [Aeropyrum pernix]GBF08885.1 hypothetical protein apy_06100 [Aeropyrum pernix]
MEDRPRGVSIRRRISILMDVWERMLQEWEKGGLTRERAIEILKEVYGRERIKPLKGAANPPDLFEKELASLYVVGKYGMGLESDYPELFDKVFHDEIRYEEAIKILLTEKPSTARMKVETLLGGSFDENTIARMLRLKLAEVYFGFSSQDSLKNLLKRLSEAFPEYKEMASKYARFYIAFKIADDIQKGEVRDRLTKEATKQALALEFSWLGRKVLPDDTYIRVIAEDVFKLNNRVLDSILPKSKGRKGKRREERRIQPQEK